VAAFNHSFGFVENDAGYFNMAVGRFVECGGDDFCIDAALHVGYFFGALVDKENHNVCFRVILRNGVCDVFEK